MEKEDFRTLDDAIRSSFRKKGIALIKKGVKKGVVAQMFGVDKNTVTNWWKNYQNNGTSSFKSKKRGVKSEDKKLLSTKQEQEIQKMIIDTMPNQLKLDFALWTRKAVKELVEREFGVVLAINTMGDYLRKWGFTPQKPKKKAYEQCSKMVQKWIEEEYPAIQKRAKEENAEIQWGDEFSGAISRIP
jgi:transposase